MSNPLSPENLAQVPEVQKKFIQYRNVLYGTHSWAMSLDDAGDELATALRDAVLSAERQRLLGMTPEAVVEAAVDRAIEAGRDATRLSHTHSERTYLTAGVRAALPLLLAPEVAKREAAEKENEELRNGQRVLARFREQAEAERDRLKAALEKYGRHFAYCPKFAFGGNQCSCGFDAALSGRDTV